LSYTSPDGDAGYPGRLDTTVTYSLDETGALTIAFDAKTTKPTIVNMTNHAIFNLAGEGSPEGATGHMLTIPAKAYTPVSASLIPTGELRPVEGTVFDFRQAHRVDDGIREGRDEQIRFGQGYDHNFALDKGLTKQRNWWPNWRTRNPDACLRCSAPNRVCNSIPETSWTAPMSAKRATCTGWATVLRWSRRNSPTPRTSLPSHPLASIPASLTGT
jgi:galactose mutarotase-like enzyme